MTAEAHARWLKLVPEGARAWQCTACGATCQLEARTDCLRTKDRAAACGFLQDQPDFIELAWPFYVREASAK